MSHPAGDNNSQAFFGALLAGYAVPGTEIMKQGHVGVSDSVTQGLANVSPRAGKGVAMNASYAMAKKQTENGVDHFYHHAPHAKNEAHAKTAHEAHAPHDKTAHPKTTNHAAEHRKRTQHLGGIDGPKIS